MLQLLFLSGFAFYHNILPISKPYIARAGRAAEGRKRERGAENLHLAGSGCGQLVEHNANRMHCANLYVATT